jgi:hypothetical protein
VPTEPDPINRWLGDDSPPPGSGSPSSAYNSAGDFVARLDADASLWAEVTPPSYAFEYDGRYATQTNGEFDPWTYAPHCGCDQCSAHRQLHENPTQWSRYVDEWRQAAASYDARSTSRPRRRAPRLRSFYERIEYLRPYAETYTAFAAEYLVSGLRSNLNEVNFDLRVEQAQQASASLRDLGVEVSFITTVSEPVRRLLLGDLPLSLRPDDELDRWADDGGRIGPVDY